MGENYLQRQTGNVLGFSVYLKPTDHMQKFYFIFHPLTHCDNNKKYVKHDIRVLHML